MTDPLFETDSVTKRFGGLTAVDDVSMSVQPGQVFGIAGPNGAGKTTFFDVVTGKDKKHRHWLTPVHNKKPKK